MSLSVIRSLLIGEKYYKLVHDDVTGTNYDLKFATDVADSVAIAEGQKILDAIQAEKDKIQAEIDALQAQLDSLGAIQ